MDVSRAAIRWAICWCLLFTVIPVGYVLSQAVGKSQAVTGKIILPEEIARFLGAPPPATQGGDGKQAAENQAQTPPATSGTALNDAPAATPQAVRGKITTPPSMGKEPGRGGGVGPLACGTRPAANGRPTRHPRRGLSTRRGWVPDNRRPFFRAFSRPTRTA